MKYFEDVGRIVRVQTAPLEWQCTGQDLPVIMHHGSGMYGMHPVMSCHAGRCWAGQVSRQAADTSMSTKAIVVTKLPSFPCGHHCSPASADLDKDMTELCQSIFDARATITIISSAAANYRAKTGELDIESKKEKNMPLSEHGKHLAT